MSTMEAKEALSKVNFDPMMDHKYITALEMLKEHYLQKTNFIPDMPKTIKSTYNIDYTNKIMPGDYVYYDNLTDSYTQVTMRREMREDMRIGKESVQNYRAVAIRALEETNCPQIRGSWHTENGKCAGQIVREALGARHLGQISGMLNYNFDHIVMMNDKAMFSFKQIAQELRNEWNMPRE